MPTKPWRLASNASPNIARCKLQRRTCVTQNVTVLSAVSIPGNRNNRIGSYVNSPLKKIHEGLEIGAVTGILDVRKIVQDDLGYKLARLGGEVHAQPDPALGNVAAAPARFLASQGYAAIGHAYLGGEVLHACRDYQAGLARKRRKVLLGQQALLLDGLSTRLLAGLHTRK